MNKTIVLAFLLMPVTLVFTNKKDSVKSNPIQSSFQKSKAAGEKVYTKFCISCHQADGGGVPHLTPPLINTSYVLGDKQALINILLNGLKNVDIDEETYSNPMPPLGGILKDQQIADVLTYVRSSFGNKASAVTVAEVKEARSKVKK
ncbi:MAG: c-type cytochrome [Ginsengibacter sp.]